MEQTGRTGTNKFTVTTIRRALLYSRHLKFRARVGYRRSCRRTISMNLPRPDAIAQMNFIRTDADFGVQVGTWTHFTASSPRHRSDIFGCSDCWVSSPFLLFREQPGLELPVTRFSPLLGQVIKILRSILQEALCTHSCTVHTVAVGSGVSPACHAYNKFSLHDLGRCLTASILCIDHNLFDVRRSLR